MLSPRLVRVGDACDYSEIWGKAAGIGLMDFHVARHRIVLDAEISTTLAA
jgi:hypothetical protein